MTNAPSLTLVIVVAALIAVGVYLMLERSLTRVLIGLIIAGNGVNLLLLSAGGAAGGPPIVGMTPESEMADPLPQALVLTAIVISLGMSAFLLAMAYRSWQLNAHDEVQDDLEDRRVARRAALDRAAYADVDAGPVSLDEAAAEVRDETADVGDAPGSDQTGSDQTSADQTSAEPKGADPTGPDPTGPDPTGPDPTGPDPTGERGAP
ncbi:Na(+)/H(+) antiporter subunit C [Actinotalea sp. M2MS4P-6]|uniref:Na(+)/H(+) antiporter subunit C n=1 Tax=Actinotalea sp. M2MS4P-6 TaxID=2983762 RepID=UPI0021E3E86D|nr:Na(+)/H(+) antiporter subunit C [Actinotalea sp. M2MS4P-6]MCV2392989.1 Na(+)/H(+) antiporter subunit C [Actinotalea sp. M2MS4P-6]